MKVLIKNLAATATAYALLLVTLAAPARALTRGAPSDDSAGAQQRTRPAPPRPTPAPSPQQTPAPAPEEADDDEVVRITTNLVQVDAVVTDKQGRQVTDLRAEDFEVLEDARPQAITNFSYVASAPAAERAAPAATPSRPGEAAPPATARALREGVRRTIAVVVDDLGMAFANTSPVKRALRKFIDERVEPGDLVAIIRTGGEVGALQQFTTDKGQMRAAVERIRWNICSRRGIQGVMSPRTMDASFGLPPCAEPLQSVRQSVNALNFIVRGMSDLPGRKSLILFSDSLPINVPDPQDYDGLRLVPSTPAQNDDPGAVRPPEFRGNDRPTAADPLQSLTELLLRASIVVYSVDTRGLSTAAMTDLLESMGTMTSQQIENAWRRSPVRRDELSAGEIPEALTSSTGGFSVRNVNDIPQALGLIMEDLRGYYLLGYRPRGETFDRRFHRITVRVRNRPDLRVRSRRGFFGVTEEEQRAAPRTAANRFVLALASPFGEGDIGVQLTPIFADSPEQGPFLRVLLHIDPGGLTFTPEADGWEKSEIVLRGILFGDNGQVAEDHHHAFALRVRGDTLRHIRRHGLEYTFHVPAKKPGPYQLRVAVQDRATSRVGSAGQFLEVPDLKKKLIAVSGLVVSGLDPDAAAASGAAAGVRPAEGASESRPDPEASPSVRRFRQNAGFEYSFIVYNARTGKDGRPSLYSQTRLYHEGRLIFTGEERPLATAGQTDLKRIPAVGHMGLGNGLPPGEYVLHVVVRDALAKGERATATQWVDFEVVK